MSIVIILEIQYISYTKIKRMFSKIDTIWRKLAVHNSDNHALYSILHNLVINGSKQLLHYTHRVI